MLAAKVDAASVIAKLDKASLGDAVAKIAEQSTQAVVQRARQKLSREVPNDKTGKLKTGVADSASGTCGRMTTDAPYARVRQHGSLIDVPQIAPNSAKALAFAYAGKLAFAKSTAAHSVPIPERSYLRRALGESVRGVADAVRRVVREHLA